MDVSDTSSTLTSSDSVDYDEHNSWNPMLELLCHAHIGVFMEALFDEEEMGRIALSCHFALDEFVFEEKAHPLLSLQTYRARPGMTKREREHSITLDDYDPQSSEVARQLGTESFLIRIDHSVHDDYVCNFLLDDLVISSGTKPDVSNVARGPDQQRSLDCFTHAMIDDSCRVLPRCVFQADTIIVSCGLRNFECTSWSKQRSHKFG